MNKIKISPSVLAADISCLGDEIARAEEGGCDDIHVDIMDGHFVPNLSFGPAMIYALRKMTTIPLDVHLMVDNPQDMIKPFADAGSNYLTIHVEVTNEVTNNVSKMIGEILDCGVQPGISLRPDTPVESIFPYINNVDLVLVMSVYPGFGGQTFIEESYDRITRIAEAASELNTSPLISVDGGVDINNVQNLVKSGANHIVAGTAVFSGHNAAENIRNLRAAIGV
ncbi:ribulose-phosphate 3-epimerase [Candidatus Latescibacterota bacterium]